MVKHEPMVKMFYDALDDGKIMSVKCRRCGCYEYPPVATCSTCSSTDVEWTEISGEGHLLEFTMPGLITSDPAWEHMKPYCIGVVKLKEGPDIASLVLGVSEENKAQIEKNLPVYVKAETVQWDGFKSVTFRYKK